MTEDPLVPIFSEVLNLPVDQISDDTSPNNTPSWDSLAVMTLVSAIEETFEVRLTTREIMKMRTIGLARQVLKEKGVPSL